KKTAYYVIWSLEFRRVLFQSDEINYSHRLFTTPRAVRFQEMEYNIPAEHTSAVITEIQECIEQHQFKVNFPLECRFVHADDIWLDRKRVVEGKCDTRGGGRRC